EPSDGRHSSGSVDLGRERASGDRPDRGQPRGVSLRGPGPLRFDRGARGDRRSSPDPELLDRADDRLAPSAGSDGEIREALSLSPPPAPERKRPDPHGDGEEIYPAGVLRIRHGSGGEDPGPRLGDRRDGRLSGGGGGGVPGNRLADRIASLFVPPCLPLLEAERDP